VGTFLNLQLVAVFTLGFGEIGFTLGIIKKKRLQKRMPRFISKMKEDL